MYTMEVPLANDVTPLTTGASERQKREREREREDTGQHSA